jgi:hypothetical protein
MSKTIYVKCPFCTAVAEVKSETGEVVNKWPPEAKLPEGEEGDRMSSMSSALKKLENAKKNRETLFDKKKGELEDQKRKMQDVFKREVEKAKREGVDKNPLRPFDLD